MFIVFAILTIILIYKIFFADENNEKINSNVWINLDI